METKDRKYKWCPNNVTIRKINEDTWDLLYHGHKIDEIFKSWTRHGGAGYGYNGSIYSFKSLKEASLDCFRKKHQM